MVCARIINTCSIILPTHFSLHPYPNQRLHHSCPLSTPFARTSAFQASFFTSTHLWNSLLDYVVCAPSATSFKHRLKMLHITEPMNISRYICQVNPVQCYHRTIMIPLIIFLQTNERNVAQGCHTELNSTISMREGRDCLTCSWNYMPLMRFIDINWDINNIHK